MINTTYRSEQKEIMDDLDIQGIELEQTLLDLDKVNKWLGGNKITLEGVQRLLKNESFDRSLKIIDVGCGNGSILKQVAQWGRLKGIKMQLLGVDANAHAMTIARENLSDYPEVSFEALNVFSEAFRELEADIILCTLTLHHFTDKEIGLLMKNFSEMAKVGVVINDLQRSKTAYYLFKAFCLVFRIREINRKDGLTSILRSFKKKDLLRYGRNLNVKRQEINYKWAFRYQWILFK